MNTQAILAKFDEIEITNESRISDEELSLAVYLNMILILDGRITLTKVLVMTVLQYWRNSHVPIT